MATNRARLWNDNDHPYTNWFKGEEVTIAPHKFLEGDLFDLNELKGTYKQGTWLDDSAMIQDPKSFSKLRLERLSENVVSPVSGFTCMKCKASCPSEKTLSLHMDEAHAGADRLVNDDMDKEIQAKIAKDKAVKDTVKPRAYEKQD